MNGKAMIWLRASVLAGATLFTVNVPAAVVSLLYLAEGELRSVGFDGTQFLGSFTSLETPDPAMSGISYDPVDDILYYLAGGELRSVGFDGTQFLGSFTSLETPDPAMSGISYDPVDDILYYLAGVELRSVGFDGTQFLGSFTSLETPDPAMSGISVIRAIDPGTTGIPEPTSLALVCLGMAVLGSSLRRSAA